jgi:hypothetical protein
MQRTEARRAGFCFRASHAAPRGAALITERSTYVADNDRDSDEARSLRPRQAQPAHGHAL